MCTPRHAGAPWCDQSSVVDRLGFIDLAASSQIFDKRFERDMGKVIFCLESMRIPSQVCETQIEGREVIDEASNEILERRINVSYLSLLSNALNAL